jgi:hypothetical protein
MNDDIRNVLLGAWVILVLLCGTSLVIGTCVRIFRWASGF